MLDSDTKLHLKLKTPDHESVPLIIVLIIVNLPHSLFKSVCHRSLRVSAGLVFQGKRRNAGR